MRIAIFSESYAPIVNGVSISVATLRREMEQRGHEVLVFAPQFPGYTDQFNQVIRFPSKTFDAAPDYPLPIPYSPDLRRQFLNQGIDIVHTQTPFLLGILGVKWARAAKIPVVTTNHTLYPEYAHYVRMVPDKVARAFIIWHMKRYYSKCDGIIVPSHQALSTLRDYGINRPVEVIQTGVDAPPQQRSREDTRVKYGIPNDVPLLLYVGRVAKEKNLRMLIKSFKEIKHRFADARLMIVGGGPILEELKANVENCGLSDSIIFTGMVPREEAWEINRSADLFVFPSWTETQGIVICEALATGLVSVVVNGGGAPEALSDGEDGRLVPNDATAFAEAVCDLLSDNELRKQMSQNALRNSKRFGSVYMADRFERYYKSFIEKD